MQKEEYILVLAEKSLKPLKDKIYKLGGFYNQIGFAFPLSKEKDVENLFSAFNKKQLKILKQPLIGKSFEEYRQLHKVDFYQKALSEKKLEIKMVLHELGVHSIEDTSLNELDRERITKLVEEESHLKDQIDWLSSLKDSLGGKKKALDVKFLNELTTNYLSVNAKPKPRLLFWEDDQGIKHTFLPKQIVAMLVGAGGAGKTHLLTQLALSVTTGLPFMGKFKIENPGAVCMVLGENKMDDIHRLLRKSSLGMGFNEELIKKASANLAIMSVHGTNSHFLKNGNASEFYDRFISRLKARQPKNGWSLIILDPISRFAGLDAEKDNAVATDFIAILEKLSEELQGEPTVLISHHKPKPSVGLRESDQTAARGASGLTDGVRWQANLDKQADKSIAFRVVKSNFTAIPEDFFLEKSFDGTFSVQESLEEAFSRGRGIKKRKS